VNEALGALVSALAKAKESIKAPTKTKVGKVSGMSKSGKSYEYEYRYADRADVIEAYREALSKNGLILTHGVDTIGESLHMVLVSRLVHSGGGELVSRIPIPQVKDAQALGSYLTYLERYAACALLDIAAEDDDDGQRAVARGKKDERRRETKPAQTELPKAPDVPLVSEEQCEAIRHAAKDAGVKTMGEFKAALLRFSGTEVASHVPADRYQHVMEQFELMKAPA
jgi:hypothetical protein